mgnify:CR=1 FL=1
MMAIIYTPLAAPLKKYVASSKLSYDATSASLNNDPISVLIITALHLPLLRQIMGSKGLWEYPI